MQIFREIFFPRNFREKYRFPHREIFQEMSKISIFDLRICTLKKSQKVTMTERNTARDVNTFERILALDSTNIPSGIQCSNWQEFLDLICGFSNFCLRFFSLKSRSSCQFFSENWNFSEDLGRLSDNLPRSFQNVQFCNFILQFEVRKYVFFSEISRKENFSEDVPIFLGDLRCWDLKKVGSQKSGISK